jgi:hypothetical protein
MWARTRAPRTLSANFFVAKRCGIKPENIFICADGQLKILFWFEM